ncbi:MAG: FtsQ-type POTRA domain-containing protein [Nitrospinae bacterium]|nr:FtsQ-type POTRA domain-containing protein [Nitrospinota bacterium]
MLIAAKFERPAGRRQPPERARRSPFQTNSVRAKGRTKERILIYAKAALLGLLLGALVVSAVAIFRMISANPYFVVKTVAITGVRMLNPEQVRAMAGPALTGNIFTRDLERAAALVEQNPWVESVSVRIKLPDIVEVAVTERGPVAAVALNGKSWLVDEKGYLIEEAGRVRPQLLITGVKAAAAPGARIADPRLFDAYRAASLFKLDTAFGDTPVAVDVGRMDKTAVRTAGGLVLKLGPDQEEWEEKFMEYLAVRGVASDFAPGFAEFDLSFKNQLVATMKGGGKNEKRTESQGVI